MIKQLIKSNPDFRKKRPLGEKYVQVAEFFMNTIQGEGVNTGIPSAFLRCQGCTLNCIWCDTIHVWKVGNPYTIAELLDMMEQSGLVTNFKNGHHFVLTGGSPVNQQDNLMHLIDGFIERFGFKPYIEVENECTVMPSSKFISYVDCWNNSPKLENSAMEKKFRYKPEVLKLISNLENAWFKFVITSEKDWQEVINDFVTPGLIRMDQIILMPCGENQEELNQTRELTVELAIRENVRFSDREHIVIWDKKTGV